MFICFCCGWVPAIVINVRVMTITVYVRLCITTLLNAGLRTTLVASLITIRVSNR
jgi:hypothetical protein